eukprot:751030-Hanusia_phi.AAC.3
MLFSHNPSANLKEVPCMTACTTLAKIAVRSSVRAEAPILLTYRIKIKRTEEKEVKEEEVKEEEVKDDEDEGVRESGKIEDEEGFRNGRPRNSIAKHHHNRELAKFSPTREDWLVVYLNDRRARGGHYCSVREFIIEKRRTEKGSSKIRRRDPRKEGQRAP